MFLSNPFKRSLCVCKCPKTSTLNHQTTLNYFVRQHCHAETLKKLADSLDAFCYTINTFTSTVAIYLPDLLTVAQRQELEKKLPHEMIPFRN